MDETKEGTALCQSENCTSRESGFSKIGDAYHWQHFDFFAMPGVAVCVEGCHAEILVAMMNDVR